MAKNVRKQQAEIDRNLKLVDEVSLNSSQNIFSHIFC